MIDTSHLAFGIAAVLALVFANGFFVAAEFSLVTVRKTRIDQLISEGHRGARTVRRALDNPNNYIASTQLGITMASLGLGWVGEPALASSIEPAFTFVGSLVPPEVAPYVSAITAHSIAVVISFAVITAVHIVLGELAPKTLALQHSESILLLVAPPTQLFMRAFWPFIRVLNVLGGFVVGLVGLKPPSGHSLVHSEEELKMLVTASQEAGVLEEEEEQMLHRVFGFSDLTAGQVMVPRTEMIALPVDAPLSTIAEMSARAGTRGCRSTARASTTSRGFCRSRISSRSSWPARRRPISAPWSARRSPCQRRCRRGICSRRCGRGTRRSPS